MSASMEKVVKNMSTEEVVGVLKKGKKVWTTEEKLKFKIPYKWKIQTVNKNKNKAQCVAYIDARDVMDLLDKAVGFSGWRDSYHRDSNGGLVCRISIKFGDEWVYREDIGVAGNFEKEKSEYSDAFKRAAVKWGIGRFLYDLKIQWIDVNQYGKPIYPHNGEIIWDLTEYINSKEK